MARYSADVGSDAHYIRHQRVCHKTAAFDVSNWLACCDLTNPGQRNAGRNLSRSLFRCSSRSSSHPGTTEYLGLRLGFLIERKRDVRRWILEWNVMVCWIIDRGVLLRRFRRSHPHERGSPKSIDHDPEDPHLDHCHQRNTRLCFPDRLALLSR